MQKQALAKRRHETNHGDCILTREYVGVFTVPIKYNAIRAVDREASPELKRPRKTPVGTYCGLIRPFDSIDASMP